MEKLSAAIPWIVGFLAFQSTVLLITGIVICRLLSDISSSVSHIDNLLVLRDLREDEDRTNSSIG